MVKSTENGSAVPPFLLKCYQMVDDQSTDALISWSKTGDSFVIWKEAEFSTVLLPQYFKHSNFSSFVRQLNIYGFRKIDTDRWEFANDEFIKGQSHLLKNISRRKHSQNQAQRRSSEQQEKDVGACNEDRNVKLWKEVECLKTDKNDLMQELIKLRNHQQTSHSKLLLLREQLKGMEKNQQQMLSFIVMAMQSPGFLVQLLQPKENSWRMSETSKNILKEVSDEPESLNNDGAIVRYHPLNKESAEELQTQNLNSDDLLELDLSSDEVRDLLMNIDIMPGPVEQKFISVENQGPLVLPDLPDGDGLLEKMLLCSPFAENDDDSEDRRDGLMEMEATLFYSETKESHDFELPREGSKKYENMKLEAEAKEDN